MSWMSRLYGAVSGWHMLTIYQHSTATDRGHCGLTKPLPYVKLLSVQR